MVANVMVFGILPLHKTARLALVVLCTSSSSLACAEQDFPDKPIRFVVDYPPGGVPDIIVRSTGQKVSKRVGQPVIVENRSGAGGQVAIDYVANSKPDGYTSICEGGKPEDRLDIPGG